MTGKISRRSLLGSALVGTAVFAPGARAQGQFAGKQLVAQGFGGPTQDILQAAVFDPLDRRLGCHSTQVPLQSSAAYARMRAEAPDPQIDLYQFSGGQQIRAGQDKLLAPLGSLANLSAVPANMKDPNGGWVNYAAIAEGLLYRTDKIKTPPRSYKDFLDPEYDGHIAFPTITNGYGADFLVMMARAYGGSEKDVDPGFKAIAKIASHSIIFRAASEVPGLFAQNDVWIIPYDSSSAKRCVDSGLPVALAVPEEGSVASFCAACIAAKSRNLDLARAAVDQFISPESQIAIAQNLHWTPTNQTVTLPSPLAEHLPKIDQLVQLDEAFITQRLPQWTERWNREIAR